MSQATAVGNKESAGAAADLGSWALLVGRIFLSGIFLVSGVRQILDFGLFSHYMTAHGMPAANFLLAPAMVLEFVCGAMLVLGACTRGAALAFVVYTLILAFIFHAFWSVPAHQLQAQLNLFLFHLTTIGGMLALAAVGPGGISLDHFAASRR